jgi:hypothetical protein
MRTRLPATTNRVPQHTAEHVNERIHFEMEQRLLHYIDRLDSIEQRLKQLDQEWDTERSLEANAAILTVIGSVAGMAFSRYWALLPAVVGGFLLQHALQGWCPPLPVFRRMGFRTQSEIEQERYLLKAIRGDLEGVTSQVHDGDKRAEYLARLLNIIAPSR